MLGPIKIKGKVTGFRRSEKLEIGAENYFEAFYELGKKVAALVQEQYKNFIADFDEKKLAQEIARGHERLDYMEKLSNAGAFKIDGVNYLQRYLSAFYGTAQGVGLTYPESMMMQMETIGCQTIMVQDKKTGVVRMVHAEEDSSFSRFGKEKYRYRVVDIKTGTTKVKFYYYPELFGWGPAIGINETTGMVLCIDDLIPTKKYSTGNFTSMAVAFMMLDCGDLKIVDQIMDRLRSVDGLKLEGGYAIHMAQADEEKPVMRSAECIYDRFEYIEPVVSAGRNIIAQSNCPINEDLKFMASAAVPEKGKWNFNDVRLYVEMRERRIRMLRQAKETKWLKKSAQNSVEAGLKLLALPEGDVNEYIDAKGKIHKYFTGLPSRWVLAHFSCFVGKKKLYYQIGKFLPKPIKGKEYSIKYRGDYAFKGKNVNAVAIEELMAYKKRTSEKA